MHPEAAEFRSVIKSHRFMGRLVALFKQRQMDDKSQPCYWKLCDVFKAQIFLKNGGLFAKKALTE